MAVTCETDENGNKVWINEKNKIHREDGPALEFASGSWEWLLNGKRHRVCGPSINWRGRYQWYVDNYCIISIVRLGLMMNPDLPQTVHLGLLAKRMLELGDDRLWEIIKPWL